MKLEFIRVRQEFRALLVLIPLLLVLLLIPRFFTTSPFTMHVLIMTLFYAFLAGAWNLVGGYVGQFSLGHSGFYGLGAYTAALLFIWFSLSPILGIVAGMAVSAVAAVVIGYPCFRLRGHYFVLITIAFAEVLRVLFNNWSLVGGAIGVWMPVVPDSIIALQFHTKAPYYYLILGLLLGEVLLVSAIERSKLGYYFKAIRDDQDAAEALGINPVKYKLIAAAISGALTAIGGAFYLQYVLFVDPTISMSLDVSLAIALPAIIGGMGTVFGPILGSLLLTPVSEYFRASFGGLFRGSYLVLQGLFLMVVVIFMPGGLMGLRKTIFSTRVWKLWRKEGSD